MIWKITGVTSKSNDWKLVDATDLTGVEIQQASANRVDKKGNTWAQFDQIVEGGSVEADFWRSDAGKPYLFAPKPPKTSTGANRGQSGANIAKVMETKNENITKHAENKDKSITLAAAQRDAVLMVTTFEKNTPFPTDDQLKEKIKEWREWFLAQHDIVLNRPF